MGLIIAGDRSGSGKTTITLALLASLRNQGKSIQSFKVGPDYIDPMFHTYVTDRFCRNLDPVLTSPEYVQSCYRYHSQTADCAVVEGVMGLFDGLPYNANLSYPFFGSTAHVARLLSLPVILVIDCSRLSGSVAAIAHGFRHLDPQLHWGGVILNKVASFTHQNHLEAALASLGIAIMGVFYRDQAVTIPDRHLGLIPTEELPQLNSILDRLAEWGKTSFDWEKLALYLSPEPPHPCALFSHNLEMRSPVRLAIAQDKAFSFYYADNCDHLQAFGVELIPWSPLGDRALPPAIHGLYFGGGFPEVFAQQLSENYPLKNAIRQAITSGIPTYAECGGLMYLCQTLTNFAQETFEMIGLFPPTVTMAKKLTLGYRQATVLNDSPLVKSGTQLRGHEFHRSQLTPPVPVGKIGQNHYPLFQLTGTDQTPFLEGWTTAQVHASYLHLHWGNQPQIPLRFIQQMTQYAAQLTLPT